MNLVLYLTLILTEILIPSLGYSTSDSKVKAKSYVETLISGTCQNINGVNFSAISRPTSEDEINGPVLDNTHPSLVQGCVEELVDREIIFSHETNNISTLSLDLDRSNRDGDLNNYTFDLQNVRKILTNRFGDQLLLFDFNRIKSVQYDFDGTASMRYAADCEGWLSYSFNGHTYWNFMDHLTKHIFIPSLEHSFVDFSRLEVSSATEIDGNFFGIEGRPKQYSNKLENMIDDGFLYGRSYDQSHFCRYYYEDLKDFALGNYVQKSDMRKTDKSLDNFQRMDTLEIGVSKDENSFLSEEYFISDEISEFVGYPRVLITNPRDFSFKKDELFLASLGINEDDLVFGTDFLKLVKNKMDLIQSLILIIKKDGCENKNSYYDNVKILEEELEFGNIGLHLVRNGNCLKKKDSFTFIDLDLNFLYQSTQVDSVSMLSPAFMNQKDELGFSQYMQAIWVKGFNVYSFSEKDINVDYKVGLCPQSCIGDLPCVRKSIDEKYYACVSSDVDLVMGCENISDNNKSFNRCLALRNIKCQYSGDCQKISSKDEIIEYLNSFVFPVDSDGNPLDLLSSEHSQEQISHIENNSNYFFDRYFDDSYLYESSISANLDHAVSEAYSANDNQYQNLLNDLDCSEGRYYNIDGPFFMYPTIKNERGEMVKTFLPNQIDNKLYCIDALGDGNPVELIKHSCNVGVAINDQSGKECKKYPTKSFNCEDLNPYFHRKVESELVSENSLELNIKFEIIAPGIVRIDSKDSSNKPADFTNNIADAPNNYLRNYIIFDDERSIVNLEEDGSSINFLFDRSMYTKNVNDSIDNDGEVSSRIINREILQLILGTFQDGNPQISYIANLLQNRMSYRNNELAQKYAACLVADFLFDDLVLEGNKDWSEKFDTASCYLNDVRGAAECLGAGEISTLNDNYSFHQQYLLNADISDVLNTGYPKSLIDNSVTDKVNLALMPAINILDQDNIIDHQFSRLINTRYLQYTLYDSNSKTFDINYEIEDVIYQRNFYGASYKTIIENDMIKYDENNSTRLYIVGKSYCDKYKEVYSADGDKVVCMPDRIRILYSDWFKDEESIFFIRGFDHVEIHGLDIELVIDPRLAELLISEDKNLILDSGKKYIHAPFVESLENKVTGEKPHPIGISFETELLSYLFNSHREYFITENKFICEMDGKTYTMDFPDGISDEEELYKEYVEAFELGGCDSKKYIYDMHRENFFMAQLFKNNFSQFTIEDKNDDGKDDFLCGDNVIFSSSSPSHDSKLKLFRTYFDYINLVKDVDCDGEGFILSAYLENLTLEIPSLFEVTDNKYVQVSNLKISGMTNESFIKLYGNHYQEVDGVYFDNDRNFEALFEYILSGNKNFYVDELKKNLSNKNTVISFDNGGSKLVYQEKNPFPLIHESDLFLSAGGSLDRVYQDPLNDYTKNLKMYGVEDLIFPYYIPGISVDNYSGEDYAFKNIKKFLVYDDFMLFNDPVEEEKDVGIGHLDVGDYSYLNQCYYLASPQIEKCEGGSECELYQSCIVDSNCKTNTCHPTLFYCTTTCSSNFKIDENIFYYQCGESSDYKCVNGYCSPRGCENRLTTVTNSTFKTYCSSSSDSDDALLDLKNINGLIFRNKFTHDLNCSPGIAINIENELKGDHVDGGQEAGLRVEANYFNRSGLSTSGNGEGNYVGAVFNNIFYNSQLYLKNSYWRNYWMGNFFYLDEEFEECCLFKDSSDHRYSFSAPFYGRHVFERNVIHFPDKFFMQYNPEKYYMPDGQNELFNKEGENTVARYDLASLASNNTLLSGQRPLKYESRIIKFKFISSLIDFYQDHVGIFEGFGGGDIGMTYSENNTLKLGGLEDILNFYTDNDCALQKVPSSDHVLYKKYPLDDIKIEDPPTALISKKFADESFFNMSDDDPYSQLYYFRKDIFGTRRRFNSLNGPIEDDGVILKCLFD